MTSRRIVLAALALLTLVLGGIAGSAPSDHDGSAVRITMPRAPAVESMPAPAASPADPSSCDLPTPEADALLAPAPGPTRALVCRPGWVCCEMSPIPHVGCIRCARTPGQC